MYACTLPSTHLNIRFSSTSCGVGTGRAPPLPRLSNWVLGDESSEAGPDERDPNKERPGRGEWPRRRREGIEEEDEEEEEADGTGEGAGEQPRRGGEGDRAGERPRWGEEGGDGEDSDAFNSERSWRDGESRGDSVTASTVTSNSMKSCREGESGVASSVKGGGRVLCLIGGGSEAFRFLLPLDGPAVWGASRPFPLLVETMLCLWR